MAVTNGFISFMVTYKLCIQCSPLCHLYQGSALLVAKTATCAACIPSYLFPTTFTQTPVSFTCTPECYFYLIPQPWQTYQKCVSSFIYKLFRNRDRSGHCPCLGVVGHQVICFVCLLSPQHHAGSVWFIFVLLHKRWWALKWDSIWCQLFTAVKFLFLFIQPLLFLTPWCNSP